MKNIKLLGLSAVVALAAFAAIGAGSASATSLCAENSQPQCPTGKLYALPATLNAHSTNFTEKWGGVEPNVCSSDLTLQLNTNNGEGKGLSGQLTALTVSGCSGGTPCHGNHVAKNLPYSAALQETTGGNGKLTLSSGGSGNPAIELQNCIPYESKCTYEASNLTLNFTGGVPATLQLQEPALKSAESNEGKGCAGPPTISATYTVSPPLRFPFSGKATSVFSGAEIESITCGSSIEASSGGMITGLSFSSCGGACSAASALNLPYATSYANGQLTVKSGGSGEPTIQLEGCFGFAKCKLAGNVVLDYNGSLVASKEPLTKVSGLCASTMYWTAAFPLSQELWLSKV